MKFDLRSLIFPFGVLLAISFAAISLALGTTSVEAPFVAESSAAMTRTMADMDVMPFSDVDNDFVAMVATPVAASMPQHSVHRREEPSR